MKRELQETADGSHTLFIPEMDEHYHSVNGAVQESRHVFIEAGLHRQEKKDITVFEVGFGTGLNAYLTLLAAENEDRSVDYFSVELYPLDPALVRALNYGDMICPEKKMLFTALHSAAWNEPVKITDHFTLHKIQGDNNSCTLPEDMDLIYFDAFAPDKQPEMWSQEIFDRLYAHTSEGGILTTYCAKGVVRRMMQKAGYSVERIPGPPGKREMLRAIK
ncbi:tRNA (5-methylaminomethyl-2-thiouridine)(34)-methyltransferase MnmD [Parabacteroides faecis]|uniref:tRNA (5-methylaminomethyl-2-thiouridine)(34)-methyltransferase MnmD n=1 Tax=Parabacteroides TaxID=375288 RepID=UPI000F00D95D|nr:MULTISPECIES: tRNA (5-methylaminomethyl-2-thiouridine)(34)-methyltransferase MnmD [Parabacteroides]MBC8616623.1 tRNA (5-methylaminomethyl-2-thiouridine)(34)-methyltransferase MnmD [Parabacteroides faecis]RHR94120.1 SAM-dependent methyltransferase [Parabacteroides sp. AF14-59]